MHSGALNNGNKYSGVFLRVYLTLSLTLTCLRPGDSIVVAVSKFTEHIMSCYGGEAISSGSGSYDLHF